MVDARRLPLVTLVLALVMTAPLSAWRDDRDTNSPEETQPGDEDEALPAQDPIDQALGLLEQGRPGDALAALDEAVKGDSENADLHYARGVALAALSKRDEAVAAWTRAKALKPDHYAADNALGAVALDAGRVDAAISSFQAALQTKPEFVDAHYNLGRALMAKGELEGASKALTQARELAPDDADILFALAQVELKRHQIDAAIEYAATAAKLAPEDMSVRFSLGKMLMRAQQPLPAVVEFQLVHEARPEAPNVRQWLARSLVAAGRASEALPHLAALAEALPDQAIIWGDYADAQAAVGALDGDDGALAYIDKAFALKPTLTSAHLRKIGILAEAGRCRQARGALAAFKKTSPVAGALELAETSAVCKKKKKKKTKSR
jgi:tetratricopeptide (TPR) repeat protein